MSIRALFKSKTADRFLSPVKDQIVDLIESGSTILEIGCGTGDLLFKAANKIKTGVGIDIDEGMIEFANRRKSVLNLTNLTFKTQNVLDLEKDIDLSYDVSTTTLCLHEMNVETAISAIRIMSGRSSKVIISDYTTPKSLKGQIILELEEIISGHYNRFKQYIENGEVPYLVETAGCLISHSIETDIEIIKIWVVNGRY